MVVSNGRLNDGTAVLHESDLNPTTKLFKQNNNPLDVVYKKQAKFYVKNLIIGTPLEQIDTSKINPSGVKKVLDKASNPKDVELRERLNKLKDYNDVGRNLPSPTPGFPPFPTSNNNNNYYDNDDDNDFLPPLLFFPYLNRMPPTDNIPRAQFLTPPLFLMN